MALVTHKFKLDLTPGASRQVLYTSQGDIGRPFEADLYWNGSPWMATGTTANIRGKKPDDTVFDYTATVSGTAVTFETTEQMTIISGPVECELVFSQGGDVIASANFVLMVEESPYDPNALSESDIPTIGDLIEDTIGGDIRDEVDALITAHPELMLQDNAVTTPKLANNAVTTAKIANFSTDYKSNAGIVEQLNTLNSNIATTQTMDAEFMYLGGEFGAGKTDAQKETNTTALQALFNKYNAICFKCNRVIETLNFSITISAQSNFSNFTLYTYYNENVDAVFKCTSVVRFPRFYNVTISNQSLEYCNKGMVFGSLEGSSNISATYISMDAIELVGFNYPLILFTFNCNLGEIHINNCKYSAIILGTSVQGGAIYSLNCEHGVMLGCYIDETETVHNTQNAYLLYSNIGIISHDGTVATNCVLGVGKVRGVKVNTLSYEIGNNLLVNIINGYTPAISYLTLILDNVYPQGSPSGKFYSNTTGNTDLKIIIGTIFGEYLVTAAANSDYFNGRIINNTLYLIRTGLNSLDSYALSSNILIGGGTKESGEFFNGKIGNVSGTSKTTNGLYSHGRFLGTLNKGESIKIELFSSRSAQESFKRSYILQASLLIGNSNYYNHNNYKTNAQTLINFTLEEYTAGNDYNASLLTEGLPTGFTASVDSSGSNPAVIITGPALEGNNPAAYVFSLEVIGGYQNFVSIVGN